MRKFFRSPVLMIMSMMLPIVQLVILGHAFGGKMRGARVAVVDHDQRPAGGEGPRSLRLGRREYRDLHDHRLQR